MLSELEKITFHKMTSIVLILVVMEYALGDGYVGELVDTF